MKTTVFLLLCLACVHGGMETCGKYQAACLARFSESKGSAPLRSDPKQHRDALERASQSFVELQQGLRADQPALKVGISHYPPFVILKEGDSPSGYACDLWEAVANQTALKYEYVHVKRKEAISNLETGTVDVLIKGYTRTHQREGPMNFSIPIWFAGLGVAISDGKQHRTFIELIERNVLPLVPGLCYLAVTLLIAGTIFWLTEYQEKGLMNGLGTGIWLSAVTMTTVGYGDEFPKSKMGKCFGFVWLFVALFVCSGFTALISSEMTVAALDPGISGLRGLGGKKVGVIDGSYSKTWVEGNTAAVVKAFPNVISMKEALIATEVDAIVGTNSMLSYIAKESDKIKTVGAPLHFHGLSFLYRGEVDAKTIEMIDAVIVEPKIIAPLIATYFTKSHDATR